MAAKFPDLRSAYADNQAARRIIYQLSSGGDARIVLDPETGLNRYLSGPYPRKTLAFASSTANDMSVAAFDHLLEQEAVASLPYDDRLQALRGRIIRAYGIEDPVEVVFAPSGTDLEFVALAAVAGRGEAGTHNILLGADEVGSGCIYSANGRHFAGETALGVTTQPGTPVAGLESVTLIDIPVRTNDGHALRSRDAARQIRDELALARSQGQHALLHVVHGSKTGLILPKQREIDALISDFGDELTLVVDACQARIIPDAVRDYISRGAIVFITGSKFMGGPPFSGMAIVPAAIARNAAPLPAGFADIFRRAEWGEAWRGREILPDAGNPGLALRLEASIFELERFFALEPLTIERAILAFQRAVDMALSLPLGFAQVLPHAPGKAQDAADHPVEMLTLATLDISSHPAARTFEDAQVLYRSLDRKGLRLGQPVKCVRLPEGGWGGTLRVGISMPQLVELACLDEAAIEAALIGQLSRFATALGADQTVSIPALGQ